MTEAAYKDFFETLSRKRIIGHDPENGTIRFMLYDPDFFAEYSKFDLDINHFCLLLSRPDLEIPTANATDLLEHPCSFLIIKTTNGNKIQIDETMAQAELIALKFWAKLRNIQEENIHLFEKVTLGKRKISFEKIKGLPDQSAGVEMVFSLSEMINYYKYLDDNDWQQDS